MGTLKPNARRAKIALILIGIVLALEGINLISSYLDYGLLQTMASGVDVPDEAIDANDLREFIAGVLSILVSVVSAVTFLMWFRRAYYNLHQRVSQLTYSEGWATGSWFVPVLNLYRPYKIMKELYLKTKELLVSKGVEVNPSFTASALGWWWGLWIISGIAGRVVWRFSIRAETLDELITSSVLCMTSEFVDILLSLIAFKVVRDYSAVEPLLHEIRADEASG